MLVILYDVLCACVIRTARIKRQMTESATRWKKFNGRRWVGLSIFRPFSKIYFFFFPFENLRTFFRVPTSAF